MPKKQQSVNSALVAKDIIVDHVYCGPHEQVSHFRVIEIGKGVDHQGKAHEVCVTAEAVEEPNRRLVFSMAEFLGWAVRDATGEYEKIPKAKSGAKAKGGRMERER